MTTKEEKRHFKYSDYFVTVTLIGIIVLVVTIVSSAFYVKNIAKHVKKNQQRIEILLEDITDKNSKITNENAYNNDNYNDFIKNYYSVQANWLNTWLTILAGIMAVLGIMIPICFVKFLENKEKEMDRIILEAKEQKIKTKANVREMTKQLKEVTEKSNKMTAELEKVKQYVQKAEALSKYNKALNLIGEKKTEEAKQPIIEAYNLNDKDDKIMELYAICVLFDNHEYEKAIDLLGQAIDINPEQYNYYYNQADGFYKLKKYLKAIETMELALEKCKNYAHRAYCLSRISVYYAKLNNKQKYKKHSKEAFQLYPNSKTVIQNCKLASTIMLDYEDMITYVNKGMGFEQTAVDYYNLTEAYIFTNRFNEALRAIEEYATRQKEEDFKGIYQDDYEKWMKKLNESEPSETIDKIKKIIDDQFDKHPREEE